MELTFTNSRRGERILQINDARIIFRNFEGRGDKFNREGDRNFSLVIPTEEIKDALMGDTNEYGVGWNVKVKDARDEGADPFIHMPVKVKFTAFGPNVYLKSGNAEPIKLDEDSIGCLDQIDIESVDLDIRAYDDTINGRGFRSAYLQSMYVVQDFHSDRFANR